MSSASTAKAGWQREREAKQKQKQWESNQQNDHQEWQANRSNMIKKKEEAELKAKEAEEKAPEFMKKLGTMREKSMQKPKKKEDEGPTIEELDDGTDIPPWHRPNAPEKPEWVVLLLLAAAKEAEEYEDEEEHVLVSGGGSKPARRNSFNAASEGTEHPGQQPWQREAALSPRKSPMKSKSASAALEDKPEWMKGAEAIRKKKKPQKPPLDTGGAARDNASSPVPGGAEPAWMAQRSKIKEKAKEEDTTSSEDKTKQQQTLRGSANSPVPGGEPAWMAQRSKIKQKADSSSAEDKTKQQQSLRDSATSPVPGATAAEPAWMAQRSKIKEKAKEEAPPLADNKPAAADADDGKPAWMRQKLKPRVSVKELQTSKVQEKLEKKEPIRQPSIKLTKEELTGNVVQQKLAKRPSLLDKKAPAKPDEMEWMKKKLKPRGSGGATSPVPTTIKEDKDDGKPAWMKHKLKPRVSVKELQTSKVQEKLEKKEPIRQPSIKLTKEELTSNIVKEKLSKRPSLLDKKAPAKPDEMEWMKKKLKPSNSNRSLLATPDQEEQGDKARPSWFKEASSRGLIDMDDENEEDSDGHNGVTNSKKKAAPRERDSRKPLAHEEQGEKRPEWMKEAHKRMPSLRSLSVDLEDNDTEDKATLSKQGSMRRIATMPESGANNLRDGVTRRQSNEKQVADVEEKGFHPSQLFPVKPVVQLKREASLGSIVDLDDSSRRKRSTSRAKDKTKGFWNSTGDIASSTDNDDGSSSTDSDETGTSAEPIDFTASMNDISAVMGDDSSLRHKTSLGPSLSHSKSSAPDLLGLSAAERRKSRMSATKKSRAKSRSKSGESIGSKSSHDKKKKKKDKDKDKDKDKKKKKKKDEEKKKDDEKKKKRDKRESKKTSKADTEDLYGSLSAIIFDAKNEKEEKKPVKLEDKNGSSQTALASIIAEVPKTTKSEKKATKTADAPKGGKKKSSKSSTKTETGTKTHKAAKKAKKRESKKESKKDSNGQWWTRGSPKTAAKTLQKSDSKPKWWAPETPTSAVEWKAEKEQSKAGQQQSKGNWWSEAPKSTWWTAKTPKNEHKARDSKSTWCSAEAPNGHTYYYNTQTMETTWTKPPGF